MRAYFLPRNTLGRVAVAYTSKKLSRMSILDWNFIRRRLPPFHSVSVVLSHMTVSKGLNRGYVEGHHMVIPIVSGPVVMCFASRGAAETPSLCGFFFSGFYT